jgi:probable rRNA maturation factor
MQPRAATEEEPFMNPPVSPLWDAPLRAMPVAQLSLSLQFARHEPLVGRHRTCLERTWVSRCLRTALRTPAELTVRVVGLEEGRLLNRDYRQRDKPTNVLTFDYTREPVVMADLVLCAPVVEEEAMAQGKSLQNHYAHLLVHGALHAQGWDHETDEQAAGMEALESRLLATLGVPDPWSNLNH